MKESGLSVGLMAGWVDTSDVVLTSFINKGLSILNIINTRQNNRQHFIVHTSNLDCYLSSYFHVSINQWNLIFFKYFDSVRMSTAVEAYEQLKLWSYED